MIVHLPSALHDYTAGQTCVEAQGATLGELLGDLDRRFPGMRFRLVDELLQVRRHIKLFVEGVPCEDLDLPLAGAREVHIVCALSGG